MPDEKKKDGSKNFTFVKRILIVMLAFGLIIWLILSLPTESLTQGQATLIFIVIGGVLFLLAVYYIPLRRLIAKPTSYIQNTDDCLYKIVSQGGEAPVSFYEKQVVQKLDYDININLGKYHYVRFKHPEKKTTYNFLYDTLNKQPVGEIRNTKLDAAKPEEAIQIVTGIIQNIETGKPIEKRLSPTLIKEVQSTTPPKEEEKE